MRPGARKFALTAHISCSVGWLGAVAAFLALSIAGLMSEDPQVVRAAYLGAELTTTYVIVPLSIASLVSGVVQALGSPWGLLRHYWVLIKLLMTIVATLILLLHTQPIGLVAETVAKATLSSADLRGLRVQLVADASAAMAALVVTVGLSVYKPRGMTRYGRRRQHQQRAVAT